MTTLHPSQDLAVGTAYIWILESEGEVQDTEYVGSSMQQKPTR